MLIYKIKINRTENIDISLLDKLTFINQGRENNLGNISIIKKLQNYLWTLYLSIDSFTIKSLTDYVSNNKSFENITEQEIYSSVLLAIILGYINVYLTPYPIYEFEENKTYVPKRFTQYMQTMVDGADQYIGLGNMYNGGIENLNELQLYMMSQMEKPTTKIVLETSLKKYLIQNRYKDMNNNEKLIDEEYDFSRLFDIICHELSMRGYIQPATL